MAHDIMAQFYSSFNLSLQENLVELTRIIDQSSPTKDLQNLFPQLINNIFAYMFSNGCSLRNITSETQKYEYEALMSFLEPQGPMFRLCYKLLSDPQLKYNIPLNSLPLDMQMSLERGRSPQFYADMLATDSQSFNVVALALNPFDYYIFSFALHLVENSQNKISWENWNSVYFDLVCDYLIHFLPTDPNVSVLPHIPNYSGKVPLASTLQTSNRPLYSPSLLLIPDLSGSGLVNQHTSQTQSRNEVWRSETVLQVFVDIWMSVQQFDGRNIDMYQRNFTMVSSSPERVRIVRVLVKHLHSFSAKHLSDPAIRSSALRKYARQIMCARGYHYIKHLVTTWPLDASFRLVMEVWLSLIQPWRYVNHTIYQDRFPTSNNNQDDQNSTNLDASFIQFIAENFPSYTCIFQLVLSRFMKLDLTAFKNAVMLFRLGKVFSQQDLVPILWNLEKAIVDGGSSLHSSPDTSFNNSALDQSYTYNGVALNKWAAIAKQAISELNMSANFEYDPVWSDNTRPFQMEFVKKIISAKSSAEKSNEDNIKKRYFNHQGLWAHLLNFFLISGQDDDKAFLDDYKKVPAYLDSAILYFSNIFGLNENTLQTPEPVLEDNPLEHSSFVNSTNFPLFITNKLRSNPTKIYYMGDPDIMPIMSFESTILVRMFYQISTRLNEMYQDQFIAFWNRNDFLGHVAREILQEPRSIQTYVKDVVNHQNLVRQNLPPRLSLRRLASYSCVVWFIIGYIVFTMFSYNGLVYILFLLIIWTSYVSTKAGLKMLRLI